MVWFEKDNENRKNRAKEAEERRQKEVRRFHGERVEERKKRNVPWKDKE